MTFSRKWLGLEIIALSGTWEDNCHSVGGAVGEGKEVGRESRRRTIVKKDEMSRAGGRVAGAGHNERHNETSYFAH